MRRGADPARPRRASYRTPGRLIPKRERGLRARSVILSPGERMDWHSTHAREELLISLSGAIRVEIDRGRPRAASARLRRGQTLWLPARTRHRVLNPASARAHYIYVTGAA